MKTIAVVQPSSELGGLEIGLWTWIRLLDPERFRRLVILPHYGPIVPKLRNSGVEVRFLPMMQLRSLKSAAYQGRYMARFWPTVYQLARLLRKERADLVHSNSLFCLYGGWAAQVARLPHIWHVHEIPDQPAAVTRALTTMATTLSDRVMVITRSVETIFSERSRATGRIVLVAEGIDVERFSPIHSGQRVRTELGIEDGRALVGWAGRLDPWKGAEVFLRAAARVAAKHPSARFAIFGGELVGYQDYAMELHELSAKLGLQDKLTFTGWQYGWDDMPEVMAAVDVLVHTSVRPEPLGLVVLEAMATGKPVVASDAGGPREVVQPGKTGYLCTPGNDVQIAEAVGNLLESNELRDEMGEAGRQSVQVAFDAGRYANEIAQLFEEVLA